LFVDNFDDIEIRLGKSAKFDGAEEVALCNFV